MDEAALNVAMNVAVMATQVVEEDDADDDAVYLLAIRIATEEVEEVMALEEGQGLADLGGESWTYITVDINEYHDMPDRVFRLHFRMGKVVFEALCDTLHQYLRDTGRLRRERRPFRDVVLMVLWILATPDSFRSVALRFGVSPGTLYYFYGYIIEALRELAPHYIQWPDNEDRERIRTTFEEASGFPGVVGSIDCTHVYVTAPVNDPASYRNRHHTYSHNVQVVVDCDLLVRDIHVGEVGSMNDKRVFRRSPLSESLLREEGLTPPDEHLVGDGGYTLTYYMMIPFLNNGHLTEQQLNFNKRLSQCRVRVENAFARGKEKWRRLKFLHARNQNIVVDHITACFVLHNFIILNGEQALRGEELAQPINNNQILGNRQNNNNNVNDEEDEDPDGFERRELFERAKELGLEKRLFLMQHVLPDGE
ncbi:protein ALP1-like [Thrips palmi]|uniref:Protein ALP1-like n=1 Tax=Thrips palmi TaxID=161013 RepID=A0A6P8Y1H5_THRPL|nr:protein ALP1-like [Thrips palmi]